MSPGSRVSETWPDETRGLVRRNPTEQCRTTSASNYDTDTSATSDNMNVLRTEQIGRSRAWRLLFSTDLHQATPSHAEPYCSSTWAKPQDAEPYCSPKTISNMRRGTPIVPRLLFHAYCSLRADETREQQPKIRGPRLRTEQD
jgi:hypothetical protein